MIVVACSLQLAVSVATLVALGSVFRDPQAGWASAAIAMPKFGGYVFCERLVNSYIEKIPVVKANQEADMALLSEARVVGKLGLLAVAPFGESSRGVHERDTYKLVHPLECPIQGVLNATHSFVIFTLFSHNYCTV